MSDEEMVSVILSQLALYDVYIKKGKSVSQDELINDYAFVLLAENNLDPKEDWVEYDSEGEACYLDRSPRISNFPMLVSPHCCRCGKVVTPGVVFDCICNSSTVNYDA